MLDTPEYVFEVQEFKRGTDQMVFIHLHIHKWTLSVLKRICREFAVFRKCVDVPLYAIAEWDDEKWAHFVSLFGFKFLNDVNCTDGKRRRLFIHLKDFEENERVNHSATIGHVEFTD